MRITIRTGGRRVAFKLPDKGDVEIDLSDVADPEEHVGLEGAGPSSRRLYRWMVLSSKDGNVFIDPVIACEQLQFTSIGLGRTLAKLGRLGIVAVFKKHDASGKVIRYDVKILDAAADVSSVIEESVEDAKSPWAVILEDIEADIGEEACKLFVALCKMADVDGNIAAQPSEVLKHMESPPKVFPSLVLGHLEEGGWVLISDEGQDLSVSVLGFDKLRESVPWHGQQLLPAP